MEKVRYVFDLDGTIFSIKPFIKELNQYTNQSLKIKNIVQYDLFKVYGLSYQNKHDVDFFQRMLTRVFSQQQINEALVHDLKRWHVRGIEIVLLTARSLDFYDVTHQRLHDCSVPYDRLIMNQSHKTEKLLELKGDRFFDDRGSIMMELMSEPEITDIYELTLIDAPYNQDIPCYSRYKFLNKRMYQKLHDLKEGI